MVKSNLFNLAFFYEDMRGSGRLNFTDYLIGEPFGSGDEYEVPVRLYSSSSKTGIIFVPSGVPALLYGITRYLETILS